MNYEVESKARIENVDEIRSKIKKIAKFVKKQKKEDEYYSLIYGEYPKKAFRIRKTKQGYYINFKKWLRNLWDNKVVVKQEYEFKINNNEELDNLIALFEDLGFKKWVKKEKICEIYSYNKDKKISIELNNVKKLGYFIEIEKLCQKNEIEKAKKEIHNVLKELGIKKVENTGYTKLLWGKMR